VRRLLVALVAVIVALGATACGGGSSPRAEAPAALVRQLHDVPARDLDAVGPGTAIAPPRRINGTALRAGGKPVVLYIGAEYCPFCATQRWPLVIALSRFGTFSHLGTTHSSSTDNFPDTATFTFHGAQFRSRWIALDAVETHTNQPRGNDYAPLDHLTPSQQRIFRTYANPPYVSNDTSNGIPLVDFGGRYLLDGATYDPAVLHGESRDDISRALRDPHTPISQGALGAANTIIATICLLTNNQPASACGGTALALEGAVS
jgi:hypothetical protein